MNSYERCKVCNVPFFSGDKALWCKMRDCPETSQRWPNDHQVKEFRIGEKNDAKVG